MGALAAGPWAEEPPSPRPRCRARASGAPASSGWWVQGCSGSPAPSARPSRTPGPTEEALAVSSRRLRFPLPDPLVHPSVLRPSARTRRVELPPGSFLPADRPSGPTLRSPSLPPAVPPSLLELPACVREPGSRASLSPGAAQSHLLHILFFSRLLLCFSTCSYVCHA